MGFRTGVRLPSPPPEKPLRKKWFFSYIRLISFSELYCFAVIFFWNTSPKAKYSKRVLLPFGQLKGEYNITAERSGAISLLRKQKYHSDEVGISLKVTDYANVRIHTKNGKNIFFVAHGQNDLTFSSRFLSSYIPISN